MSNTTASPLAAQIESFAGVAGLTVLETSSGQDYSGNPTARFTLALDVDHSKTQLLELSEGFDASEADYAAELTTYFADSARRLKNPRPDVYLSLLGLPVSFSGFGWPFHGSTSGADTSIVHGLISLETGEPATLHAKVSASLTQTFQEIVTAMEQPFAESFIYNAIRKTLDQGQLELTKSGNRQPVPVTTRYYSMKQRIFIFNDTNDQQRAEFIAAKVYWLSSVLGGNAPVWIADPRDAQYLNTTVDVLKSVAAKLAGEGLIAVSGDDATATPALTAKAEHFQAVVADAMNFIKPHFNEDMRAGNTNM